MVRKRIAISLSDLVKTADASAHIKSALLINNDDPETFAIMGKLYLIEKDYSAAQRAYTEAISLSESDDGNSKGSPAVQMGLAEALIEGEKLTQAEKILSEMSQREQFSPLVHKLWGDLYKRKGMHKEAVEEYRAASLSMEGELEVNSEIASLDIAIEDSSDHDWEAIAQTFSTATADFLNKKRHSEQNDAL